MCTNLLLFFWSGWCKLYGGCTVKIIRLFSNKVFYNSQNERNNCSFACGVFDPYYFGDISKNWKQNNKGGTKDCP